MTREDKGLLLKDLCGRIVYGVKCTVYEDTSVHTLSGVLQDNVYNELYFSELDWKECDGFADVQYCKPFLFPLSSMTDAQIMQAPTSIHVGDLENLRYDYEFTELNSYFPYSIELIDWLNKNHFDYRGLIERGLAIDATGLNIY